MKFSASNTGEHTHHNFGRVSSLEAAINEYNSLLSRIDESVKDRGNIMGQQERNANPLDGVNITNTGKLNSLKIHRTKLANQLQVLEAIETPADYKQVEEETRTIFEEASKALVTA